MPDDDDDELIAAVVTQTRFPMADPDFLAYEARRWLRIFRSAGLVVMKNGRPEGSDNA